METATVAFNESLNRPTGLACSETDTSDNQLKVITYYAIRLLQSFLALVGNSLTIIVIIRTPALHTGTAVLLGSLALADLLSSTVSPITICVVYYAGTSRWAPLCVTKETITMLSQAGNLYSVFYISVDRYFAVAFPIRHIHQFTTKMATVVSALTWCVCALAVTVLVMVLSEHSDVSHDNQLCFYSELLPSWVLNGILLPQFAALSLATVLLYGRICMLTLRSRVKVAQGQCRLQILVGQWKVHQPRQRKLTRTLIVVMGLYLGFTLPAVCLSSLVNKSDPDPDWLTDLYNVAVVLWYNLSFVNPIMYAWQAPDFRRAFHHLLKCCLIKPKL